MQGLRPGAFPYERLVHQRLVPSAQQLMDPQLETISACMPYMAHLLLVLLSEPERVCALRLCEELLTCTEDPRTREEWVLKYA